jgi:hypothetical protein
MEKEVAKHVAASALRCATQLSQIIPFAKTHCSADEYTSLAKRVASAMHAIHEEIFEPALAGHPDLKREIEDSLQKFGVVV